MSSAPEFEDFFTCEELAKRLNVSAETIRARCAAGFLPATRIGRRWLVSRVKYASWLAEGAPSAQTRRPRRAS